MIVYDGDTVEEVVTEVVTAEALTPGVMVDIR